jgi:general secretion pathway protein H
VGSVKKNGFTLIELLVVLVVMGIALGMAVVQLMPDSRAALRDEAQRLALLLENAGLDARASGRPLAWSYEANGYRFWKRDGYGGWVRVEDDPVYRARVLPEGMAITEASVESQPLQAGERMPLGAASHALPFLLRLSGAAAGARITGSSTGEVAVQMEGV